MLHRRDKARVFMMFTLFLKFASIYVFNDIACQAYICAFSGMRILLNL